VPVSAATLSKLIAAGLSGQELIDVVASIDADMDSNPAPKKRSAGAIRQERYRERKASQSVTGDVTESDAPLSDKEKSPTPPKEINYPPSSLRSETKRATRLPADWSLPSTWGQWALQQGHSEAHIRLEADKFRDFWCSKSGKDATKVDWLATWRNWIRNSKPAAHRGQAPPPRLTHHQQRHHDALKAADEFIGINRDEPEFAGSTFDLDPGDFRSH